MQIIRNGSFHQKKLKVSLLLGSKNEKGFDEKGNNTVVAEGLRVSAQITSGGGNVMPSANITIYGLSKNVMDRITKIRWNTDDAKFNFIRLEALHDKVYVNVFEGMISFAYPNFGAAPEVMLTVQAITAFQHQIFPTTPTSVKGEVSVAGLINEICQKIGMGFENNGVTAQISNPYLPETGLEQIKKICQAADIDLAIEAQKIAISPKGKGRNITIPVISPETGLIGYPVPDLSGVKFKCLFDPMIRFHGIVEIRNSIIDIANGQWFIYGLTYYLDSEIPNGRWQCDVSATYIGEVKIAK